MRKLPLLAAIGLLSFAGAVSASSLVATTDTIGSSLAKSAKASSDASSSSRLIHEPQKNDTSSGV